MRLGDLDKFKELFDKQIEYGATDLFDAVEDALQDTQIVDPETLPIVQELRAKAARLEKARENANEACGKWEHKCYDIEKQLKAAIMDMEALMWHSGEGCQICKHSIEVHKFPYVRLECKLGAGADCKPEWRYSDDHANK